MKILIVSELFPRKNLGGLARHALNLGRKFREEGHDVGFLGNSQGSAHQQEVENVTKSGIMLDDRLDRGKWIGRVEGHLGMYPYAMHYAASRRIAAVIEKRGAGYDVIHYHGHYPTIASHISPGLNLVVTHHDHGIVCPLKVLLKPDLSCCDGCKERDCAGCFGEGRPFLFRKATDLGASKWQALGRATLQRHKHIFVSARNREIALGALNLAEAANLFVVHNFIDCRKIDSTSGDGSSVFRENHDRLRIFLAAAFAPYKGIGAFMRRVAQDKADKFDIVVAGDGGERAELERQYGKVARFVGWLSYEETVAAMRESDFYVLPSLCEESCSTTILEALYLGRDVRALRRGGTVELLQYADDRNQMKLYEDMASLVSSLSAEEIYAERQSCEARGFGACLTKKAEDVLEVYKSVYHL